MKRPVTQALCAGVLLGILLPNASLAHASDIEPVSFRSHGGLLSGDIVFPDVHPATAGLVLVQGANDLKRKLVVAEILASDGFAVLTYDKRGSGRSGGVYWGHNEARPNFAGANLNLLADDAAAAMDVLTRNPRLRGVPLGFVGFSQAGWIIPIAATRSPAAKFVGLWSGPVCTVSEQLHFQDWAANDPGFWRTHTQRQVDEYMKSVRHRADDIDPRTSLSKLSIPGLWLFGAQDNEIPVALSVARLETLIQHGHPKFEYGIFAGYGHNVFDTPEAPAYRQMVAWIKRTVAGTDQFRHTSQDDSKTGR
ncbi:MAG TPA: prolyl oligopeptidase family serine peptidase [Rhizomicrobium sp.]|jgi:hypothetical protein|nr:prolyl oligopeptidase family serine peptidase [Rhizomicrobium sp.]